MKSMRGIILAGGKSRRFGLEDKTKASYGNQPMIQHAVSQLHSLHLATTIVARPDQEFASLGCAVLHDVIPDMGPLGGLYTACRAYAPCRLLVLTCDMPEMRLNHLTLLIEQHEEAHQATIFDTGSGRHQPFPGIYQTSIAHRIRGRLAERDLSMRHFLASLSCLHRVPVRDDMEGFRNINTPGDMRPESPATKK